MSNAFNKFNQFVADIANKAHNLGSDSLKILLTNTAPNAADTVVDTTTGTCTVKSTSNAPEITAEHNYSKGGTVAGITSSSQSGGTYKLIPSGNVVFTATGGTVGPFRYAVLYNNSGGTTSTRPVVGWYDYLASVTLNDGETFTVQLDGTNGILQLA